MPVAELQNGNFKLFVSLHPMRFFAVALLFSGAAALYAQAPEVPHKMQFAGMTLTLRDDARRDIQKDVDALTQYSRYFIMKVERAKTYFPFIEKIFAEEGVPQDFKFLVLQESALVADAVSVSNAVGFWQFLDFTALEMGLRVDKDIDERMNLVSATRAAAKYIKQNNYFFNNWLLALQSYQMGAGGVRRAVGDSYNGAKHMEINSDTYWYVKKYLAHKIAFENALTGEAQMMVVAYEPQSKMLLKEIAAEVSAEEEKLREYNKWLKGSSIPDDKTYTVFIPVGKHDTDFTKLTLSSPKATASATRTTTDARLLINSIPALVAKEGESLKTLAQRGGIRLSALLKYNEVAADHRVKPGGNYFLSRKKAKAGQPFYKAKAGDDPWSISQQFGVRVKNVKRYNRIKDDQFITPGSMVWLNASKPKGGSMLQPAEEVVTLEDESFDWYTRSPSETVNTAQLSGKQELITLKTFDSPAVLTGEPPQNRIKPGQISKVIENEQVKGGETVTPPVIFHEVKSSDTLYSIARQYGVTIKDIMAWNDKKDFSVSMGEKLKIQQR